MRNDVIDDDAAQEPRGEDMFNWQAQEELMKEPDERVRRYLVIGSLGDND